jgi:4-hydroxy-tetrahydrodipicolinate reductase
MGRTVCEAVAADPDLVLGAGFDTGGAGAEVAGITVSADRGVLGRAQVVVDFTVAAAARDTLPWLAAEGIHAVVGTTGFSDDDLDAFRTAFTSSNCLIAPNFAIGAVLMMRFAALAAPYFDSVEVIELHHDQKVDAPSGTAARTAELIAEAKADWAPDPTRHEVYPGARGGVGPAGVHVHSVRLRGLVAHQEVLLGTTAQLLTIRHDSFDRTSFMPGVVLACKRVADHPGVTIGLDGYLGS